MFEVESKSKVVVKHISFDYNEQTGEYIGYVRNEGAEVTGLIFTPSVALLAELKKCLEANADVISVSEKQADIHIEVK